MSALTEFSTSGANFGLSELTGSSITLLNGKAPLAVVPLENASLCVVPTNNRDEVEIQFATNDEAEKKGDCLVQMTLHFPTNVDKSEPSEAQLFHQKIIDAGIIKSITGDIIVEFTREQGNFVAPRGKYTLQMATTYFYMQGAQYAYKIQYDDINSLFLLPKIDGGRMAFVISLDKAIKQGNQRYPHLVLDTHSLDQTVSLNLTDEEIAQYDNQLQREMTMPLSNLIAKVFKVLSDKKVFIPKQFTSAREAYCVRCSIKANEGLLYPLAKAFIFIHKPTIIIKFEDIEIIEFKRYEPAANSATRNFDLAITLKQSAETNPGDGKEFVFMSIDRSEYVNLFDYINSKEIPIKNPQSGRAGAAAGAVNYAEEEGDEDEDDDDYSGGGDEDEESSAGESNEDEDEGDKGKKRGVKKGGESAGKKQKK